jgi:protein-L-isoaspartate(D-aspartate) O-methyltransferase
MDIETARLNMIEQQIRPWGLRDPVVLELLGAVRREDFVPPALRALAFADTRVPLLPDRGESDGPCMLEPRIEARLMQELNLQRNESVLEIGAGSGFMAALMAHRAQRVVTLECRPELARAARDNLRRAGVLNVQVVECSAEDGAKGYAAEAPYDAILLSGSVREAPAALLEQLKPGGRLVAIIGEEPVMRATVITRESDNRWSAREAFDTVAQPLEGFPRTSSFKF